MGCKRKKETYALQMQASCILYDTYYIANKEKMTKSILFVIILVVLSCSTKIPSQNQIYIEYDKLYGELKNGVPERDTLIELNNKSGNIIGIGKMAVSEGEVSNLKFDLWKEYDSDGILLAEGNYKISSFVDCGVGGVFRIFYHYRIGNWNYFAKNGALDFELEFTPKKHSIETRCENGDEILFGIVNTIPLRYWDKVTANKLYEMQKISYPNAYHTTTFIPLNGKIYVENTNKR